MAVIALITVAPILGRLLVNHLASRLLGEPVTVSWLKVGFAPLRLTAIKVHLGSPLGPKAERVTLTFPGSNLWQGRIEPQTIEIVGLRASADLSDNAFEVAGVEVAALAERLKAPPGAENEGAEDAPVVGLRDFEMILKQNLIELPSLRLSVDSASIVGGAIKIAEGRLGFLKDKAELLKITSAAWELPPSRKLDIALTTAPGHAEIGGYFDPWTGQSRLNLALTEIPVSLLLRFLRNLPLQPNSGSITAKATLEIAGESRLKGKLLARDLKSAAPDLRWPKEVAAVAELRADFEWSQKGLAIDTLRLNWPYLLASRHPDRFFPLTELGVGPAVREQSRAAPPVAASPGSKLPESSAGGSNAITLRSLAIHNGRLDYVDHSVTPPLWVGAAAIEGSAAGFSSTSGGFTALDLTFRRDEILPGSIKISRDGKQTKSHFKLPGTSLISINPWLEPALGYRATAGRLDLEGSGILEGSLLRGKLEMQLRRAGFESGGNDEIKKATGVALPLALALLEDPSGIASLELDVEGDLSRRSGRLSPLVSRAAMRAVAAALVSPLAVLGSLFKTKDGSDTFTIDPVPFPVGSAVLEPRGQARVEELGLLLGSHPELLLVLKPLLAESDESSLGRDALPELAASRSQTLLQAFQSAGLPAARLLALPWSPADPRSPRPGGAVELRERPDDGASASRLGSDPKPQ